MDRDKYIELLQRVSINNTSKFTPISLEQPKKRGRRIKHFLEKEKDLNKLVKETLSPEEAADVIAKGSKLAHLYGLPKTQSYPCGQYYQQLGHITTNWPNS